MSISHCHFYLNEINSSYGMIFCSHGTIKIRECYFYDNYFINSNCIETYSSQVYIKRTHVNNNIIASPLNNLFYAINSIIEINNSTFNTITSSSSSLFRFEYRTYLTAVNAVFSQNSAQEIIYCDGACNLDLTYSIFIQNYGILFKATSNYPIVILKWCQIESNNVPAENSLFDLKNGRLIISKPNRIVKNHAFSFVDFHNSNSLLSITNSIIERNIMSSHFAYGSNFTNILLLATIFSHNFMPNGAVIGDHINIKLHLSTFKKNVGQPVNCQHCHSSVYLSSFIDCTEPALVLTGQNFGNSLIASSQFFTSSPNNQNIIYVNSSALLVEFSRFSQSRKKALQDGQSCFLCEFNQMKQGTYLKETFFVSGSCILVIAIIVVTDIFGLIRSLIIFVKKMF